MESINFGLLALISANSAITFSNKFEIANNGNATFAGAGTFGNALTVNTANSNIFTLNRTTSSGGYMRFQNNGTDKLYIGSRATISGSGGTGYDIYTVGGNDIRFFPGTLLALTLDTSANATFTGDVNITQTTDVGVLNATTLDNGSAVGLSITYPTSNVGAGDGLAIAIGIAGRGRSYIANSNLTTNLDASNLAFYTESGGVIGERMIINQDGNVGIGTASPVDRLTYI